MISSISPIINLEEWRIGRYFFFLPVLLAAM